MGCPNVCNDYMHCFSFSTDMPRKKTNTPPPPDPVPEKAGYHHGDLRRTLLDAALRYIDAHGLAALSMRELARQAGVSPAAPFRHFATRTALLTALAEEGMDGLVAAVDAEVAAAAHDGPLQQFRAVGAGFLRWSLAHPTHLLVISSRAFIDFEGSTLRRRNDRIREAMDGFMRDAARQGLLRPGDVDRYLIGGRALVYGIARMYLDGQFPSWDLDANAPLAEAMAILDQYIAAIGA